MELVLTNVSSVGYLSSFLSSTIEGTNTTLYFDLAVADGYLTTLIGLAYISVALLLVITIILVYHVILNRFHLGFR